MRLQRQWVFRVSQIKNRKPFLFQSQASRSFCQLQSKQQQEKRFDSLQFVFLILTDYDFISHLSGGENWKFWWLQVFFFWNRVRHWWGYSSWSCSHWWFSSGFKEIVWRFWYLQVLYVNREIHSFREFWGMEGDELSCYFKSNFNKYGSLSPIENLPWRF